MGAKGNPFCMRCEMGFVCWLKKPEKECKYNVTLEIAQFGGFKMEG